MPWFVGAYLLILLAGGIYNAYDDRREGRSASYLVVDAGVAAIWAYFVAAYLYPWLAATLVVRRAW